MSSRVPCFRLARVVIAVILILVLHGDLVSSSQIGYVCNPGSIPDALGCTQGKWLWILSKTYAPRVNWTGSLCELNSTCNLEISAYNNITSCNGPFVRGAVSCDEDMSMGGQTMTCLKDEKNVASQVTYECIDGASVLDMCNASRSYSSEVSSQHSYLASPNFPHSTSSSNMCTCILQGSDLRITAIDINVLASLPWNDTDPAYNAMFTVRHGNDVLAQPRYCQGCTETMFNTDLVNTTGVSYANLTITYSGFGVAGQKVWLKVYEYGRSLNVTCTSSPLPANRIISTTTSAAATTTPRNGSNQRHQNNDKVVFMTLVMVLAVIHMIF